MAFTGALASQAGTFGSAASGATVAVIGPGSAAGLSAGAATGIGALVALPIVLGLGLLAAHDKRVQIAKTENQAVDQAVQAFDTDIRAVVDGANKGTITAGQAIQLLQQMEVSYWAYIHQYQQGAANNCGTPQGNETGCFTGQVVCTGSKTCTAGCCVGCNVIRGSIANAMSVFQSGGGTFTVCHKFGSKFGGLDRPGYKLTYSPPPIATTVEGTITQTIGSTFSSLFGGGSKSTVPGVYSPGMVSQSGVAMTPLSLTTLIIIGIAAIFAIALFRR